MYIVRIYLYTETIIESVEANSFEEALVAVCHEHWYTPDIHAPEVKVEVTSPANHTRTYEVRPVITFKFTLIGAE